MRRLALVAILLLPVGACASADRPEGTVERWLSSLDQGEAGRPDRYADDEVTAEVAPRLDSADPGWIDTITVGEAGAGANGDQVVPFRIEPLDGDPVSGMATVGTRTLEDGTTRSVVWDVEIDAVPKPAGGWHVGAPPSAWLIAFGIGGLIALAAAGLVGWVDRAARRA